MASSEVDQKFLGQYAKNIASDNPFLSSMLFKILGLSVILTKQLVRARRLRKLDPTRATKSLDLYFHILWLAREGLAIVEDFVLPIVAQATELKVLAYKLRASFYHIYVQFHNQPPVSQYGTTGASPQQKVITTPPGLTSPRRSGERERTRPSPPSRDKGKAPDRGSPPEPAHLTHEEFRASSVQPAHPLEGSRLGGKHLSLPSAADFLLPAADYIPLTLSSFQSASSLADAHLWGSHPLRLSVRLEFCAFLYDCMKDEDGSRNLAKRTIAEVYNANEGMDDEMFEDAAELVGVLGRMMRRGVGGGASVGGTPRQGGSEASKSTPSTGRRERSGQGLGGEGSGAGMDNPI